MRTYGRLTVKNWRKIYESPVPVISAIGHETDFTICDFVADLRAPTPSAAAELAVPDIKDIIDNLDKQEAVLKNLLISKYKLSKARLEYCLNSAIFKNPKDSLLDRRYLELDRIYDRLCGTVKTELKNASLKFARLAAILDGLSPLKALSRGYAAVEKDGAAVNSVKVLNTGDNIALTLSDGKLDCTVNEIVKENTDVR